MELDIMTILTWLAFNGGNIMAASWILERVAWYQGLKSDVKEYVFFGLAAVLGVGSYAGMAYIPAEAIEFLAPYFLVIGGTFSAVFLGKVFHRYDKK